jgi:NAD(P)H-flavin reductase
MIPSVIDPAAPQYNATLVHRADQHGTLAYFSVRFDGDATPFVPGQYMTIGIVANGKLLQRPYSVASDPHDAGSAGYEFLVRLLPDGRFTPVLWQLREGHRVRLIGPKGKLTLEPQDDRVHLFVSSGTGCAPFVSMLRSLLRTRQPRRCVFLNGVSYESDLAYRAILEGWQAKGEYPLTYVPTVSRPGEASNAGWRGRTGRVESIVASVCDEQRLEPSNVAVYICGQPAMAAAVEALLVARGFAKEQMRKEVY